MPPLCLHGVRFTMCYPAATTGTWHNAYLPRMLRRLFHTKRTWTTVWMKVGPPPLLLPALLLLVQVRVAMLLQQLIALQAAHIHVRPTTR